MAEMNCECGVDDLYYGGDGEGPSETCPFHGNPRYFAERVAKLDAEIVRLQVENASLISVLDRPDYHIVRFTEDGWVIQHPPQDGKSLFDCPYNQAAGWDSLPDEGLGDYRWDTDGLTKLEVDKND